MADRSPSWMAQARHNLDQARVSRKAGHHDWACFAAQQAAEMALKALHLSLGEEVWGHVVRKLLEELPPSIAVPQQLFDKARALDAFYIPARYPNGHPEGAPFEHYGDLQSAEAIRHAEEIVGFSEASMADAKRG